MMKRRFCISAAILLAALGVTGCMPAAMPTPTSAPAPTSTPVSVAYAIEAIAPQGFAAYEPIVVSVRPQVSPYEIDLSRVANADLLARLGPEQRALLERNGFVVVPSRIPQIYDVYKAAKEQNIPIFVTTDALLHTFHILYDYTLRTAEIEHFVQDLQRLNAAMVKAALEQYQAASGRTKEAALKNAAYFAVASRLLDPQAPVPHQVKDLVDQELALIEEHAGFADSPIFGYREDYSQYVPRGHYTRNETFERYFKAMMWYGRLMFRLRPGRDEEAIEKGREETRQAILIVLALQKDREALAAWERIYEPTVFFVGRTDDLTVYDYSQAMREVYGETLALGDLEDDARLDDFIARAMTLRPPKIVSSYVTDQERPEEVTKGFRFMGQRFIPDSYIFQQLVYDKVGTAQEPRLFPKGLDVLAALGSERAYEILDQVYHETRYARYEEQMAKLRDEFSRLPPEQWTENLYWSWLHTLRPLLEAKGEGYPTFMRNQAWTDKQLFTALGSWTELRHDTILYAKQSYTMKATGIMPQPEMVRGCVEPQPEVWARLAALTRQMRAGLGDRGLLNEEYRHKLDQMESLLLSLKAISEKELAGQALTEEEVRLIRDIGGTLEAITTFSARVEKEITSEADERMAIVADVHTDVNTGQVLEEGVGDAFLIYVVAPIEGDLVVAQGGVFSYYEFLQPM
ncbi:MAG TPA: DUF3160 domain-containing protein, partial [Anaerolineae bacterium]|nr:DUF3160 domain-containing protein [Anaerolineae bacterium]